jgi:hypothetical protein
MAHLLALCRRDVDGGQSSDRASSTADTVVVVLAALTGLASFWVGVPGAQAAMSTTITVNGSSAGPAFGGMGAISGGGGDTDSTDGSESSTGHTKGTVNCDAGYEFWLMTQAKARNPNIKLYGLAWGAPGWISGGFFSTDAITYLVSWLNCAKSHGLTINYLGGWDIAGDIAKNSTFANAVSIIGVHYPCGCRQLGHGRHRHDDGHRADIMSAPCRPSPSAASREEHQ